LPDTRTAIDRAQEVEPKCKGSAEAGAATLIAPALVERVEPENAIVPSGNDRRANLMGARMYLLPAASHGQGPEEITRSLECHQMRAILGQIEVRDDDPYVLPDRWLDINTHSEGDGFSVRVTTDSIADAKRVLDRAERHVARPHRGVKRNRELREDRATWEAEHKAELDRWTPQIHAEAKALADKTYASGTAASAAAAKGAHRKPGDAERDMYRHPVETLSFFGFKPTMTVLEVGPGDGWYTELLAPALHEHGRYVATSGDPNGPPDARDTSDGQRFKAWLDTAPEVYGKVETVVADSKAPRLGSADTFDLVIVMRGLHGLQNNGTLSSWLEEIHRVLKPGGVLGIEEHRATAGADPVESAKKGYVPEEWAIAQIRAAGFDLAGKSEINANPKDTKDYPEGVWALPPTLRLGDKDRDTYNAIGESDRMTLKFVKARPNPAPRSQPASP
jgi:predicted methyltransferase